MTTELESSSGTSENFTPTIVAFDGLRLSESVPPPPSSSILTLPTEIVAEIFSQYLPPYPICPPLLGDQSPTTLTQICKLWREIAITTPMLWRAIGVFLSGKTHVPQLDLKMARVWLERSQNTALSLLLGDHRISNRPGAALREEALLLFCSQTARWQHVALEIPGDEEWNIQQLVQGPMPFLCDLEVRFVGNTYIDVLIGQLHAPNLFTAFLDLCNLRFVCAQIIHDLLPWSQLTMLYLSYTDIDSAVDILGQTPNLVACVLRFSEESREDKASWPGAIRKFSFPRLETLITSASFSASDQVYDLLSAFRAPALRRFSIDEDMIAWPDDVFSPLPAIICSMGCELDRLCILNTASPLGSYVEALPGVAQIELNEGTNDVSVWGSWDLFRSNQWHG